MAAAQSQPNPNRVVVKDANYYKSCINATRDIKNAMKELKVHKIEKAMEYLQTVLSNLHPYASI